VVAHLQLVGVTKCQSGQPGSRDFDYCDIGFGIAPYQFALELPLIRKRNLDICRFVHDVVVGEDVPIVTHDDARTQAVLALLTWHLTGELVAKKLAKERISEEGPKRSARGLDDPRRRDIHHGSQCRLQYRRKTEGIRRRCLNGFSSSNDNCWHLGEGRTVL